MKIHKGRIASELQLLIDGVNSKEQAIEEIAAYIRWREEQLAATAVSDWVAVTDSLPKEFKHRMSADVLTIAGNKMSVKCYDYELMRWSGSPHVTVKYWMELPKPPCC